jgi:ABC-type branched-subunit amino acid transport system ATPase component
VIAQRDIAVLIVEQRVYACLAISDWAYSMVAGEIHMSAPPANLLASDEFARSLVG